MTTVYFGDEAFWEIVVDDARKVYYDDEDPDRFLKRLGELFSDWLWEQSSGHPFLGEMVVRSLLDVSRDLSVGSMFFDDPMSFAEWCHHRKLDRVLRRYRRLYFAIMFEIDYALWFMASFEAYMEGKDLSGWLAESPPPGGDLLQLKMACRRVQHLLDSHVITQGWTSNWFYEFFGGENGYGKRK